MCLRLARRPRSPLWSIVAHALLVKQSVERDSVATLKRFAMISICIYVVWAVAGHALQLSTLIRGTQAFLPRHKEVTPANLEAQLKQQNVFGLVNQPGSDLHCATTTGDWDFVCTFAPTPRSSNTHVHFGVTVLGDGRIFEISRLTPIAANLPKPEKLLLVR